MEAESIRARRPVHPVVVRSRASRLRMPVAVLLSAVLLIGSGALSALDPAVLPRSCGHEGSASHP